MNKKFTRALTDITNDFTEGVRGYFKTQFLLAGLTFVIMSFGLWFLHIPWFVLVALGVAMLDIVPLFGAGLAMIPWALIVLLMGNQHLAIGLAVLYFIQFMCRQVAEPLLLGKHIGMRPAVVFLATVAGSFFLGPVGFLLGPFLAMLITIVYRAYQKNF